jgi:uncharacterized protein
MPCIIETKSGVMVDLDDIARNPPPIFDLALALSEMPRFARQTSQFYSVAEHSCHVMRLCAERYGSGNRDLLAAALTHDLGEAFHCDIPSPILARVPEMRAFAERLQHSIWHNWLQIDVSQKVDPLETILDAVEWADGAMLAIEAAELMASGGLRWPKPPVVPGKRFQFRLQPWTSQDAYRRFVDAVLWLRLDKPSFDRIPLDLVSPASAR